MRPNGEFMEFDTVECGWGLRPQVPVSEAPEIHQFLEKRVLDLEEQAHEAQIDPRSAIRARRFDLALDKQRLARSVREVWKLMVERGIVTPEEELARFSDGGSRPEN